MKFAPSFLLSATLVTLLSGCTTQKNYKFQDTLVTRRAFYGPHQYDHEGYWTRTLESDQWRERGLPADEKARIEYKRNRVWAPPRTPMP